MTITWGVLRCSILSRLLQPAQQSDERSPQPQRSWCRVQCHECTKILHAARSCRDAVVRMEPPAEMVAALERVLTSQGLTLGASHVTL